MEEILDDTTIKALNAQTRKEIIKMIVRRPHTATEMAKKTGKHVTTVKEHLEFLQKAEIVEKRDSTNRWVYYTLTRRGKMLLKPKYYSWTLALVVSIAFVFAGVWRAGVPAAPQAEKPMFAAQAVQATAAASIDVMPILLFLAALAGFAYVAYGLYRMRRNLSNV